MNPWIASHFLNPAFVAGGAALVASPIIIHLINRMRYRRVRFAAMEFLLQSQQRNRRRLLIEQLLLLLLRILVVLALVALIARLVLDPGQLSLFRGAKAHHVVVLDDSGSMRDRWGETTAFDEALETIKKLVAEGARRPDTQKFTLLLLSDPERPMFTQRDVNDAFAGELETKLESLHCSHRRFELTAGLEAARRLFAEEQATVQNLHVVSDFRKHDWEQEQALGTMIKALDEAGVTVNLVKTVPEPHENLAITGLTGELQVAAANVPLLLNVTVKNFGSQVAKGVRLSVLEDGEKLPQTVAFEKIEANTEVSREFQVLPKKAAWHRIQVALEGDALAEDNDRFLAVQVPPVHPVLIIDGDPAAHESLYVETALQPAPGAMGIEPLVESVDFLRRQPLDKYSCIFLIDVPQVPPDAIPPLEDYVAAGGGLAWFVGDAVNPAFYDDKLYREGDGLFPVPLARTPRELSRDETVPGADLKLTTHPIFERLVRGEVNPVVDAVRIEKYLPPAEDWDRDDNARRDGVATIARLRNKDPLAFEHTFGRGRIVTFLTTVGPEWNDWALNYSGPIVLMETQRHIARRDRAQELRIVGTPIELALDPARYTETVEITAPDAGIERVTRLQASLGATKENDDSSSEETPLRLVATYRDTDTPGIYAVKLLDQNQIPEERWFAYNAPTEESELALAGNDELRQRIGEDVRVRIQEPGQLDWIRGKEAGQDVRRLLLILLIVLLVAEQLLAYRLSYHPRRGSNAEAGPRKPAGQALPETA